MMLAVETRESRNAAGAALLMHALLAAGLLVSLNWTRQPATPVQAELWSGLPRQLPAIVTPAATKPTPTPPTPVPLPEKKSDISVQKKKPEPPKKDDTKKLEQQKELERKDAAKKAAEKKRAEKQAAEKLEAQRKAVLARLGLGVDPNAKANAKSKDVATKAGVVGGAEVGSKTGIDADYEALIQAKIKARINYPDRAPGNPEAIVTVEQLPTGEITRVRLIKPSGVPAWDDAVQRAVRDASPLPKKKDGTVARILELSFRPKENP
jgi:colicin import membrane protein